MKAVRYILMVIVLAGASGGSYAFLKRGVGRSDTEIPVTEVAEGEFRVTVREVGYLKAKKTVSVGTKSQGKITRLLREGTFVKKDEPFLWMETKEIEERIKDLEVDVEVAQANLEKTTENNKLQEKLALLSLEQRLVEKGLYPENELVAAEAGKRAAELSIEKARISLDKSQRQLKTNLKIWAAEEQNSEAEYERNKRQLEREQQELEDAVIKAPAPGIIVYERTWKGSSYEKLQEGDQVWHGQEVAQIPDMSTMLAMVQVNEMDSAMVKEGQDAEVRLVAFPDLLLKGTVTKKATLAEDKTRSRYYWYFSGDRSAGAGLRTFDITVELGEIDPRLREGMTANVTIVADTVADATYVPLEAVFEGDAESQKVVYVKEGDHFEKRGVETGAANDNFIIIKSGVEPGDVVALKKPESAS